MLAAKEIDGEIDIGEPDDNYVDAIHTLLRGLWSRL
jgi:hypothetical protein